MIETIRFATIDFFDRQKCYGFARAENKETIHVHLDNFHDLAVENGEVTLDEFMPPKYAPAPPKPDDQICFLGHEPLLSPNTTARAWNWAAAYHAVGLPIKIEQRRLQIVSYYGGVENMAGICARCSKTVAVRLAKCRYKSMPTDEQLFELSQHNMPDTDKFCYAGAAVPMRLVRDIKKSGFVCQPSNVELWDRKSCAIDENDFNTHIVVDQALNNAAIFIAKTKQECVDFLKFGFVCPRAFRHAWRPERCGIRTEIGGSPATLVDSQFNTDIYVARTYEECFAFLQRALEMLQTVSLEEMTIALLTNKQ